MRPTKNAKPEPPKICPVCGEDVPRGSLACPECGADHNSGWKEDAETYDGLDLPDDDFDHDEFVQREFGSGVKPPGIKTIWWITGIIVLVVSIALYFLTT
jgi:uncharacterized membrane protein YvbJ